MGKGKKSPLPNQDWSCATQQQKITEVRSQNIQEANKEIVRFFFKKIKS